MHHGDRNDFKTYHILKLQSRNKKELFFLLLIFPKYLYSNHKPWSDNRLSCYGCSKQRASCKMSSKEFTSIANVVGACVESAAMFCHWKKEILKFLVAYRCANLEIFLQYEKKFREISPCYCVLNKEEDVCQRCPIDFTCNEVVELQTHAAIAFRCEMVQWEECAGPRDYILIFTPYPKMFYI